MSRIKPFRAWRPQPEQAAEVASPPYDVLSSEEARILAGGHPRSFLHVVKPEIDLPKNVDSYSDEVYAKGAENLRAFVEDGTFLREDRPSIYIYRQIMGDHEQTGMSVGVSVKEYNSGTIKKHENTRPKKEDDRTRHIDSLNANAGPVMLAYKAKPEVDREIEKLSARPSTYDFVAADGVRHVLWVVDDPVEQQPLIDAFAKVDALYVADGHHRIAAAARVCQMRKDSNPAHTGEEGYNFFLAMVFPHGDLQILDYNRIVRDLHGHTEAEFLSRVESVFDVAPLEKRTHPSRKKVFSMYLGKAWYQLEPKPGSWPEDDVVRRLDVEVLHEQLLAPILKIGDPRKDERIDFVGGIRGLEELERRVDSGEFAVAFAVHPTSITDLFAVADAGTVMPPKSTWFEPKLRSGLIVRPLED